MRDIELLVVIHDVRGRVAKKKKHLKIKGTRSYYLKTIGYCVRTKVKNPLILRSSMQGGPGRQRSCLLKFATVTVI